MKHTNSELPTLTRGEESVMQILWSLGDGLVYDIIEQMPEPKPKYSTVATFIKMLENKGYVTHREEGRFYRYYPAVERDVYAVRVLDNVLSIYFEGSMANLVAFYANQQKYGEVEMTKLLNEAREKFTEV